MADENAKPQEVKPTPAAQSAPAKPDTDARYDTYVVQAGDSVSNYMENLWKRNPELQAKFPREKDGDIPLFGPKGMVRWAVNYHNELPVNERPEGWRRIDIGKGKKCDGSNERSAKLDDPGTVFVYPEQVNEILNPGKPCAIITGQLTGQVEDPVDPDASVTVTLAQDTIVAAAQYTPERDGGPNTGVAVDMYNYYYGVPPERAAIRGKTNKDTIKRDTFQPGYAEGQSVEFKKGDVESGAVAQGGRGEFESSRANHYELRFRPSATWHVDANGNPGLPNKHFSQKVEENTRFVLDDKGQAIPSIDMGALISRNVKNNPYFSSIFTDYDTAHISKSVWTGSGDGIKTFTAFMVATDTLETVEKRFYEKPNAVDADKVLATAAQTAMSPVVWTVGSYHTPVQKAEALGTVMDKVFNSEQFKGLSAEEQTSLHSKYDGMRKVIADPYALKAEIDAKGGNGLYNPLSEPVRARAEQKVVWSGYYEGIGDHEGKLSKEEKIDRSEQYGNIAAAHLRNVGLVVAPGQTNRALAAGITAEGVTVYDMQRQSAASMVSANASTVRGIAGDSAQLDDYIGHTLADRGRLEKLTNEIFYSTIKRADDNKLRLDFAKDSHADKFADRFGVALGGDSYEDKMDYKSRSLIGDVINKASIDVIRIGANRNQTRGLVASKEDQAAGLVSFQEAALKRWENGTPEEKEQIRAAYREYLTRAADASDKGHPTAANAAITAIDPHGDERSNGGVHTDRYKRMAAKPVDVTYADGTKATLTTGTVALDGLVQREAATAQLGAQVETELERLAAKGTAQTAKTSEELKALAAAVASPTGVGGKVAAASGTAGGARVVGTLFNTDAAAAAAAQLKAANAAVAAGDPNGAAQLAAANAKLSGVLTTANTPAMVSQVQTDKNSILANATSSPLLFSLVALNAIGDSVGNKGAMKNLDAALDQIDHGPGSKYADLMSNAADTLRAAGNNPAARTAALDAAAQKLSAYFASSEGKNAGAHLTAVTALAGKLAAEPVLAGAYHTSFTALNNDAGVNANGQALLVGMVAKGYISQTLLNNLQTLQAGGSPAELRAAQREVMAAYNAHMGELNAYTGVSYVDIIRNAATAYIATRGGSSDPLPGGGPGGPADPTKPLTPPPVTPPSLPPAPPHVPLPTSPGGLPVPPSPRR